MLILTTVLPKRDKCVATVESKRSISFRTRTITWFQNVLSLFNRSVSLPYGSIFLVQQSNHSENVTVAQLTDVIVRYKIRLFQRIDFVPAHKYTRYKSKQSQLNNTKNLWLWTKETCLGNQDLLSTMSPVCTTGPLNCGKANWCLQALFLKSPPPWIPHGLMGSQMDPRSLSLNEICFTPTSTQAEMFPTIHLPNIPI